MDFQKALNRRANVKKYTSKKPPIEDVIQAIEAANSIPGPSNLNVINYILVQDAGKIAEIAQGCQQNFISQIPYVLVICSNPKQLKKLFDNKTDKYLKHHVGASADTLSTKLNDLGLASCWIETFSDVTIKNLLTIPDHIEIELIISIGYQMGKTIQRKKPSLFKKIFFDSWGNTYSKPIQRIRREDI